MVEGGIEAEARQTLDNVKATLEKYGSSIDKVVKCTVFLAGEEYRDAFNAIYAEYFTVAKPARSGVSVAGLALDALVELECWAVV